MARSSKSHKKKLEAFSLTSATSFLMLIVLQIIFILFMVGQLILVQAPYVGETSHATQRFSEYPTVVTRIGSETYILYVADTEERRNLGLSHTDSMLGSEGMVFLFDDDDTYGFWMKDMRFPLDFVYVNGDVVVDIKERVSPDTFPESFAPKLPADAIIELQAGQVALSGISEGDLVRLR